MDAAATSSLDGELAILVSRLANMGFTEAKALEALAACSGNVEAAASFLIATAVQSAPFAQTTSASSSTTTAAAASNGNDDPVLIQGPISQYSIDHGRSACTCIALTAAHKYLTKPALSLLTPAFLHETVVSGVATYLQLLHSSMIPGVNGAPPAPASGEDAVEHYSAEQVMATHDTRTSESNGSSDPTRLFSCLRQIGPVRQGVLNKDVTHQLGLPSMLHDCWTDGQCDEDVWTAVVVTKTPETLLVLLPPLSMEESEQRFILVDSHPRPHVTSFGASPPTQAYARIHSSLEELVLCLAQILPITVLEDEMINILYNSFDLYVLQHDET